MNCNNQKRAFHAFAKKCITALLAVIFTAGTVMPAAFMTAPETYAASKVKYEGDTWHGSRKIEVTSGDLKGYKGTCADAFHPYPGNGSATYVRVANNTSMAKVAYYACKNGLFSNNKTISGNVVVGTVWYHAMQYARCKDKYKTSKNETPSKCLEAMRKQDGFSTNFTDRVVKAYNEAMKDPEAVRDSFELWYLNPGNSNGQDFLVWKYYGWGSGYLEKADKETTPRPAGYNYANIVYGIYKADKTTQVATVTLNAQGVSNTVALDPGTYYAKEISTNQYYKLNTEWSPAVTVKQNKTSVFYASDWREEYPAKIIKKELNGEVIPSVDPVTREEVYFTFLLENTQNSNIRKTLTVYGNDSPTAEGTVNLEIGTYNVTEIYAPKNWTNKTGSAQVTVGPGQTGTIEWVNEAPANGTLVVQKEVSGVSATGEPISLSGFDFKVEGILYNEGTITAEQFLNAADPAIEGVSGEIYDAPSDWTVDADDLAALNDAAKNRQTGDYDVKISASAARKDPATGKTPAEIVSELDPVPSEAGQGTIPSGTYIRNGDKIYETVSDVSYDFAFNDATFDADKTAKNITDILTGNQFEEKDNSDLAIEATVKVKLAGVEYDEETGDYKAKIKSRTDNSAAGTGYIVNYKDFTWAGAATVYTDIETGRAFTILTTGEDGSTKRIEKGITKGKFTVTEMPTDAQKKQFEIPEPQTKEVLDKSAIFTFTFKNEQRETPVRLIKTSPDGNVNGIEFRLTGSTLWGENLTRTAVTASIADEQGTVTDGVIDFGKIPAGNYVVEETGFDETRYVNNHKLPGREYPAVELNITGEEEEDIVIEFDNLPITSLYIAKYDGNTGEFLENAEFELYEEGELAARFQIVKNDDGSPGVNMIWSNGVIEGKMSKTITSDDEDNYETPDPNSSEDIDPDEVVPGDDNDDPSDNPREDDTSGDTGDDTGEDTLAEIDYDSLAWAKITRLTLGKTYVLKETKAPKGGYVVHSPIEFVFENDPTRVAVPNFIPEIRTLAMDSETGTHIANADESVTIKDTVSYKHLTPGGEYIMSGRLMNRVAWYDDPEHAEMEGEADVTPVTVNGKEVTAKQKFTASETGEGEVELEFTFDASEYAGRSVVVYEKCYQVNEEGNAKEVAAHEDQSDDNQVVNFPKIGTVAKDPDSKTGLGTTKEEQTIIDTVEYSKLEPNVTYIMKGTLYDKTTGDLLKNEDGEPYTAVQEFTPKESSGTVEITFTINSTELIHHKVVAFEECYLEGEPDILVAFHRDEDDTDQTIEYPSPRYDMYKIRTSEASQKPGTSKYGFKPGDKVLYEVHVQNKGNVPVTADVRDAFGGDAVNYFSLPVVEKVENATMNSISENKNVVNITVETGQTAVVTYSSKVLPGAAEYLANAARDSDSKNKDNKDANKTDEANKPDNNDGWVNTAYVDNPTYPSPEDPTKPVPVPDGPKFDPAQTPVRAPEIGTYLTGKAGRKEVDPSGKTRLVDTISYSGLTPGQRYEVIGELIVKDTGDPLVEHGEKVVATGTFVPISEKGSAKVTFTVDTTGLKGKELVAFETCYNITGLTGDQIEEPEDVQKNGIKVAEHKDLKDKAQTVKIRKTSGKPKTGEDNNILILSMLFGVLSAALILLMARKKLIRR